MEKTITVWKWVPKERLGPIRFGAQPSDVRRSLGKPAYSGELDKDRRAAFLSAKSPFAFEDYFALPRQGNEALPWNEYGSRSGIVVYYSQQGGGACLVLVENAGVAIEFEGDDLGSFSLAELVSVLRKKDPQVGTFHHQALCSRQLCFAATLPETYSGQSFAELKQKPATHSFLIPDLFEQRFGAMQPLAAERSGDSKLGALDPKIQKKIASSKKAIPAWIPKVRRGLDPGPGSKFGGGAGGALPSCGDCSEPMPLFVQLLAGDIPLKEALPKDTLWQLFYCTECENDEPGADDNANYAIRLLSKQRLTTAEGEKTLPPARIERWDSVADLTAEDAGEFEGSVPLDCDKLGGTAAWVQDEEVPACSHCHKNDEMQLFFQLTSRENVPFRWGDAGNAYVFRCRKHVEEFKLVWQTS